jgi:hypothetical protein
VSAIDEFDNIASFSSVGPEVELAAPGVDVYSTYKRGGYTFMSGTSMACPHVSGAAALVWATGYYFNGSGVRLQLHRTAEWLGGLNSDQQGNGLVDAEAALASPKPGVLFLMSSDKSDYNINDTAVLTAMVSDEFGNAISDLPLTAFETNLYDVDDPDQTPIPIPPVEFVETTTAGTYEGVIDLSVLATGEYLWEKYEAIVTVTDNTGFLSGTDDVTFWVWDPTGSLSVLIEPDITPPPCYMIGDTINVRVTVLDAEGGLVPGADVHVELNTDSGRTHVRDETTNEAGVAEFRFKTKKPDGIGDYLIRVWASKSGYPSILDEMVICVQ